MYRAVWLRPSKGRQQRINRIALQQAIGQIFHDSDTDIKMEYLDEDNSNKNEYVEWAVVNESLLSLGDKRKMWITYPHIMGHGA